MKADFEQLVQEVQRRLFVEIEASGRHVHVTKEDAMKLFGHDLTEDRPLSQPGQYLAKERVTVQGPKGSLEKVAVLGPCRPESQIELSVTDGRIVGIKPPVRLSGRIDHTPGATLIGPQGTVSLPAGVIAAQRHIHMTPEDAKLQGVSDGETVRLKTMTERPVVFEDMVVRVRKDFATYVHLDYDEANACGFSDGDLGRIVI